MFLEMRRMHLNTTTQISEVNTNMTNKFAVMQNQLSEQAKDFAQDLKQLREDTISKSQFETQEQRIVKLEGGGLASTQISWMQTQLNRLDPANKSLCFNNLSENDLTKRTEAIQDILSNIGQTSGILNIEHLSSGPPGNRKLSGRSIVEMSSRDVREAALKKLNEDTSKMEGPAGKFTVVRTKTSLQMKRNKALHEAMAILKKDCRCAGNPVEIVWLIGGKNDRGIQVAGQMAFDQISTDSQGKFVGPFMDLSL